MRAYVRTTQSYTGRAYLIGVGGARGIDRGAARPSADAYLIADQEASIAEPLGAIRTQSAYFGARPSPDERRVIRRRSHGSTCVR